MKDSEVNICRWCGKMFLVEPSIKTNIKVSHLVGFCSSECFAESNIFRKRVLDVLKDLELVKEVIFE